MVDLTVGGWGEMMADWRVAPKAALMAETWVEMSASYWAAGWAAKLDIEWVVTMAALKAGMKAAVWVEQMAVLKDD